MTPYSQLVAWMDEPARPTIIEREDPAPVVMSGVGRCPYTQSERLTAEIRSEMASAARMRGYEALAATGRQEAAALIAAGRLEEGLAVVLQSERDQRIADQLAAWRQPA